MVQSTDNTLSNQSGASFRTELNSILAAHLSSHKGSTEPSYITTGGVWVDDTSTPWVYKIYDGAASFGFMEINPSTNNITLINVKDGDARTEGASIGQIQDSAFHVLGSVSGTNTITASLTPAITAYAAGQSFNFVVAVTNTGAVTINLNSLGAKAIQKNGAALVAGDLTAGDLAHIIYDGTQFQLVSPARTPVLTNNSLTYAKMQQISADLRVLGNVSGGAGNVAEVEIKDEDDMASNSATALATQQSIKAYADAGDNINSKSSATITASDEVVFADVDDSNTVKKSTVQGILNLAPLGSSFESTEIALGTGEQTYTAAHGLGSTPKISQAVIICKTAELGYSIGDEVNLTGTTALGSAALATFANSTSIGLKQQSTIVIPNLSSTSNSAITAGNWRIIFRGYI